MPKLSTFMYLISNLASVGTQNRTFILIATHTDIGNFEVNQRQRRTHENIILCAIAYLQLLETAHSTKHIIFI